MDGTEQTPLARAVACVGGERQAAAVCGRSVTAVRKWLLKGCLPRTEYSGETQYAQSLARASKGQFTAAWLLKHAKPKTV